jgi:hypothetical protein
MRAVPRGRGGATSRPRAAGLRLELRYERLADDPDGAADETAAFLDSAPGALRDAFERFRDTSIGRWRRDLTAEQLADIEAEAGELIAELGYT